MLLSMMIILAITSCALELMIAAKVPIWRQMSAKYPLFNLLNSLVISFIMGIAFGAAGLVAMGAGVISTVLSVPGYQFLKWNYDTPRARAHGGSEYKYHHAIFKSKLENYKVTLAKWGVALNDLGKLMYSFIRFLTFPIWMTRDFIVWVRPYVVKYNNYVARKRLAKIRTTP
jgi:hypothetical protein